MHFVGLFSSSLLKMQGPKNKKVDKAFSRKMRFCSFICKC